jgi:hypothetical protein
MFQFTEGDKMKKEECIKAECEFLATRVVNKEVICTDCNTELYRVCNCGIVDEMYKTKEKANA